ncbi:MAG TPA: hypothetical protein VJ826_03325 [Candidatus Polarisedimenticolaceae bacterium]|nr:hypothetical protein [Candidatus Polarisedimenticolaceae bacterium]
MRHRRAFATVAVLAAAALTTGALRGSNMGFLINCTLQGPAPGVSRSGINTVNLPWQSNLATASALMTDIGFPGVANVQNFVTATDGLELFTGRKGSPSPDFALAAGSCYFVTVAAATPYVIEGSDVPGLVRPLLAPLAGISKTGTNFVAVPYHSTADTALELMTEIGFASVTNVQRFITATDGLEVYTGRKGSPNANFPLVPCECYFIRMNAPVMWIPTHY